MSSIGRSLRQRVASRFGGACSTSARQLGCAHLHASAVINRVDRLRLLDSIAFTHPVPEHLAPLFDYLTRATEVDPAEVPERQVTMRSIVRVQDLDTAQRETFELVYPFEIEEKHMGRSVAGPLGAAIIGRSVGDIVDWRSARPCRSLIESIVYQPEREGHHDR